LPTQKHQNAPRLSASAVSFPIIVLLAVPLWILVFWFADFSFDMMFLLFAGLIIGLQPPIMRYSRAIWIGVFVKYDPGK